MFVLDREYVCTGRAYVCSGGEDESAGSDDESGGGQSVYRIRARYGRGKE